MAKEFKLTPPWITYCNEVEILFGEDPDVTVQYDEEKNVLKLLVEGEEKADALTKLMPPYMQFGNIKLTIEVVPANLEGEKKIDLFQKAFKGNPVFRYAKGVEGIFANDIYYVVFRNQVVQFYNDALNDINGNVSTLYEAIARDVFRDDIRGVFFCTDTPDGEAAPDRQ